ncbi:PTS fructose transporter subunit IIABC [Varibaculum vaginae]|uniref:PTS fructose transporter subunit IIABC n=1 Tax=Varibaculum vaginae TaxID=2364797 RepID=UPI000F095311|nr:fructose-specific PTS transporter subunit EIIC [Varibaculum vaginae]
MENEKLIIPQLVSLDDPLGADKDSVIAALAAKIACTGRAEENGLIRDLMAREAKSVTGMPGGIAIPHCRSQAVSVGSLAFARLKKPVDFGAKDGPADLIFMIAAAEGQGQAHLKLLQKLARKLVDKNFLANLRSVDSVEKVADIIMEVVEPGSTAAPKNQPVAKGVATPPISPAAPKIQKKETDEEKGNYLVAVTSCPTGIAHTYMAADSLANKGKELGIPVYVEAQGSGHVDRLNPALIAGASGVIFAHDVSVQAPERFAHLPLVDVGVKAAINDPEKLIREVTAKKNEPNAAPVVAAEPIQTEESVGWGRRIQKAVMAGVSYMIPFVAAGGLLIALGFLLGGYDVAGPAQDISLNFSLWHLPDSGPFGEGKIATNRSGLLLYLGALLVFLGQSGMSFLVPALSGYIAFGLAGRPGIAPGFIGGAISVTLGAGFIGGLVTGILAGIIANSLSTLNCPRWLAGLMPVAIVPLISTLLMGLLMLLLLGRPLAALMSGLQNWLNSMAGTSAILLGIIIGLMMCFDLGGPVNKAAYLVGTAGLSQATDGAYQFMAAVMLAGMVPPLALALSSSLRPKLYSPAEQQNGKAAWLLGLSFISEGAIPFAAADPLRVIPSMMAGGAVTGAVAMALGVGCRAPHGGIFVLFAYTNVFGALIALVAGVAVAAVAVTFAKMNRQKSAAVKA